MTTSEGPRASWKDIVHARIRKWGTTEPLTWSELRPVLYAADGRQVQENRSKGNPAGVPNEFRILTFPEREGLEGNYSAYEGISREFDDILATVSYVRSVVFPYGRRVTFAGISDVVNTLTNLSGFLVLRAHNPVRNGDIPTEIAGATKMARGFMKPLDKEYFKPINNRYTGLRLQQDASFLADADTLMQHIVDNNFLLTEESRESGTACPAPLRIIARVAKVLLEEPAPGMAEAGERLGLSRQELMRAKDFGQSLRIAATEQQIYTLMRSNFGHQPQVQHAAVISEGIILNSFAAANKALGRGNITAMSRGR